MIPEDYEKYYQKGGTYVIPVEVFNEIFNEMKNWKQENQKLLKQLEENSKIGVADHKYASECEDKVITMKNQQKEFISYLKDLIKQNETVVEVSKYGLPKNCSKLLIDFYKEILSKYKEIIGAENEIQKG